MLLRQVGQHDGDRKKCQEDKERKNNSQKKKSEDVFCSLRTKVQHFSMKRKRQETGNSLRRGYGPVGLIHSCIITLSNHYLVSEDVQQEFSSSRLLRS